METDPNRSPPAAVDRALGALCRAFEADRCLARREAVDRLEEGGFAATEAEFVVELLAERGALSATSDRVCLDPASDPCDC